jgi:hypothetical protein
VSAPDFSSRPRGRIGTAEVSLLGIAVATLALAGYSTSTSWAALRRVRQDVDVTRKEAAQAQGRIRDVESRRDPGEALATQAYHSAEASPPRVVAELAALLPNDVRLESVSVTYGDQVRVDLDVRARSAAGYDRFLQALEASPRFAGVLPLDESRGSPMRGAVKAAYRPDAR